MMLRAHTPPEGRPVARRVSITTWAVEPISQDGPMKKRSLGRPVVTIHYAQTLDGRIATRTGSSQWISGDASLRLAHELRAGHEAVLVGISKIGRASCR